MKIFFWSIVFLVMLLGCNTISVKDIDGSLIGTEKNFYLLNSPQERIENPKRFFSHEYKQIKSRRNYYNLDSSMQDTPNKLIGLGLSGGGIRSSAFQLGILSGLNKTSLGEKATVLNRVDYISSVSGGSWANGAYWTWKENRFEELNDKMKKPLQKEYDILRTNQDIKSIPVGGQRKEKWEKDIVKCYLEPDRNIDFSQNIREKKVYKIKPYPIFNSSHSVPFSDIISSSSKKALPFQVTPDYLGTIISDLENTTKGFFVSPNTSFLWINRKWQRFWGGEDLPGTHISKTMAHSSGFANSSILLQYNFHVQFQEKYIEEIKKKYKLSDGGRTENLGLLSLLERRVNLIIISHMGKDKDPRHNPFEDLQVSKARAKELLQCDVKMPSEKIQDLKAKFIVDSSYKYKKHKGHILHVKPTHDNGKIFFDFLRNNNQYHNILKYLEEEKEECNDKFPQTPTVRPKYDEKLIRAYYLLGKFIAEKYLAQRIKQFLF